MDRLKELLKKVKEEKPSEYQYACEIYQLCLDEIEQGGSPDGEIENAISAMKDIFKED
jgi:hypothetical protein